MIGLRLVSCEHDYRIFALIIAGFRGTKGSGKEEGERRRHVVIGIMIDYVRVRRFK